MIMPAEPPRDNFALRLAELIGYAKLGIKLLPIWGIKDGHCACREGINCGVNGRGSPYKHPIAPLVPHGVKDASSDPAIITGWLRRAPSCNWAMAMGTQLANGKYLGTLDEDPRNGGDDSRARLEQQYGKIVETVRAVTGQGGTHFLFETDEPTPNGTIAPGLDWKGAGGYILINGSVTVGEYIWDAGAHPNDVPFAKAPQWLLNALGSGPTRERPNWNGSNARNSYLGAAFHAAGLITAGDKADLPDGKLMVCCPWSEEHSDGRGQGEDSSTVLLPPIDGTNYGSFRCLHGHCSHRRWHDVIQRLPASAVATARAKYPFRPVVVGSQALTHAPAVELVKYEQGQAWPSPWPDATEPSATPSVFPEYKPVADRRAFVQSKLETRLTKGGGFTIPGHTANMVSFLTWDPDWRIGGDGPTGKPILQFDEFSNRMTFLGQPNWHEDDRPSTYVPFWTDQDTTRLINWCIRNWHVEVSKETAYASAEIVARRHAYHPVRDWLKTLSWDMQSRACNWLALYLGAPDNLYTRAVSRYWLISAVARVFQPGCKVDHVLILEGPQGAKKSTALANLAGRAWFTDTPFVLGSKDAYMAIRGKWIVELAELDALFKAENSAAKAFFSSEKDTFREPYGRQIVDVPRQCVFAGTVNPNGGYLRDETGNRRYWPIRCGAIDLAGLDRDREQIWAETVALYESGARWWPQTPEEKAIFEESQEERMEQDPWTELVAAWTLSLKAKELIRSRRNGSVKGYLTVSDILEHVIEMPKERWTHGVRIRVGRCLTSLNWRKYKPRVNGEQISAYEHPFLD